MQADDQPSSASPSLTDIVAQANAFWQKLPDYTAETLAVDQKVATMGVAQRRDAIKYLAQQPDNIAQSAMATNAGSFHEAMFSHDQLTSAAGLMQDVRKLCKWAILDGTQTDPINWPSFGVVWQSTFDDPTWESIKALADKIHREMPPADKAKLDARLLRDFGPDIGKLKETTKVEGAVGEVAHRFSFYILDPKRDSRVDLQPLGQQLAVDLVAHLKAAHPDAIANHTSLDTIADDALDFLASRLPESFVKKVLVPQRQIISDFIRGAQLEQTTLMGKLTSDKTSNKGIGN